MRSAGVTLELMWHDSVLRLALLLAFYSTFLFWIAPPSRGPYWATLLIAPVFLISAALTVPQFSPFEVALPVTRAQLLWARILASLWMVWLPLCTGIPVMLLNRYPIAEARQPVEFAVLFTACVCFITAARIRASRAIEVWLFAPVCAALALACLPPPAALTMAVLAAGPLGAKLWWTYVPERNRRTANPISRPFWSLLGLFWSWKTIAVSLIAFYLGQGLNWFFLPMIAGGSPALPAQQFLLGLPLSRRRLLWIRLLPVLVPFLLGIVYGYRVGPVGFQTTPALVTPAYWNHPATLLETVDSLVPQEYSLRSADWRVPAITAPWGESAQAPPCSPFADRCFYNPYWAGPSSSQRFLEWQFSRATRDIYGRSVSFEKLPAALRGGLRPITRQARAQVLFMALAAAGFCLFALLAALQECHFPDRIPRFLCRGLKPVPLQLLLIFGFLLLAMYGGPTFAGDPVQRLLLGLSASLPANHFLLTLALFTGLAPLYWALETVFRRVEFPDKSKDTE